MRQVKIIASLLCITLSGCAIGHVKLPNGAEASGFAIGQGKIEFCQKNGTVTGETGENEEDKSDFVGPKQPVGSQSVSETVVGPCVRIEGGPLSLAAAGVFGAIFSAAIIAMEHYF